MYHYSAKLVRVIDGDTVELEIDLGFNVRITEKFRLYGIDCPERFTTEGKAASSYLNDLMKDKEFLAVTIKDKKDKYGRYLVMLKEVGCTTNETISDRLVARGLAVYKEY